MNSAGLARSSVRGQVASSTGDGDNRFCGGRPSRLQDSLRAWQAHCLSCTGSALSSVSLDGRQVWKSYYAPMKLEDELAVLVTPYEPSAQTTGTEASKENPAPGAGK
jgi:hypothetical protein